MPPKEAIIQCFSKAKLDCRLPEECYESTKMKWFQCICPQSSKQEDSYGSNTTMFTRLTEEKSSKHSSMYNRVNDHAWILEKHLEEERRAREQDRTLFQQQLNSERYEKQCLRQKVADNATLTRNLILYARSLEEENGRLLHYIWTAKNIQRNIMNQLSRQPPTNSIKMVSI